MLSHVDIMHPAGAMEVVWRKLPFYHRSLTVTLV